jgi:ATP-binding cassette subfamily C (CFTR/MRP) protein 1
VRENIVFGRDFNYDRYYQVIKACALVDDLAMLPVGDMTEIGE